MRLRLTLRDGTVYEMPATTAYALLRYTAAQASSQPGQDVENMLDGTTVTLRWLNPAEIVTIAEIA